MGYALGFFAGLCGASQQAWAGEATISVLGLEPAAGAPEAVATAVTEAIRQRVTGTSGYRLVAGRDLVEVKLVFSCPDEAPACMTQAAQSIGASKLVFGNLQPVGTDAYLVTLKLLDADRGVVEGWTSEQITKAQAAPAALRAPAQKWFAALTGQGALGTIKITGGVVGASVWLDGTQIGLIGGDGLTLSGITGGSHDLVVSKAGYEKFERKVTVAAGATEKVAAELRAVERPGEAAPEAAAVPADQAAPLTQPETAVHAPNQGYRIAAWAVLGLGLVSVGLGAYSSYEVSVVNSNLDPYRRYACSGGGAPICGPDGKTTLEALDAGDLKYIKDQQDMGDTFTKVQYAGYIAGGILIATSTVFFYHGYFSTPSTTATAQKRSNLIVMPSFGRGSAGATAYLRF
jgi:hypothetical protein